MRCIDCLNTCYVDDLSTIDKLVYRCEATKEIIESVGAETACDKIVTKDPRHKTKGE